jgi:hypothetical protein
MKSSIAMGIIIGFGLVASALAQVPVRDADNPARHAFTRSLAVSANAGASQSNFAGFDVPDGQVLVVEFITASCVLHAEDSISFVRISLEFSTTDPIIPVIEFFVPVSKQGDVFGTSQRWVGAQIVRMYARNHPLGLEHTVIVDFARTNVTNSASCNLSIVGHAVREE